MTTLETWGGRSDFRYEGSITQGTKIFYKDKSKATSWSTEVVTAEQYQGLLSKFSGLEVELGHYPTPRTGSIEEWLKVQYDQWGLTSYIGPILVHEGYAVRVAAKTRIRFKPTQS